MKKIILSCLLVLVVSLQVMAGYVYFEAVPLGQEISSSTGVMTLTYGSTISNVTLSVPGYTGTQVQPGLYRFSLPVGNYTIKAVHSNKTYTGVEWDFEVNAAGAVENGFAIRTYENQPVYTVSMCPLESRNVYVVPYYYSGDYLNNLPGGESSKSYSLRHLYLTPVKRTVKYDPITDGVKTVTVSLSNTTEYTIKNPSSVTFTLTPFSNNPLYAHLGPISGYGITRPVEFDEPDRKLYNPENVTDWWYIAFVEVIPKAEIIGKGSYTVGPMVE